MAKKKSESSEDAKPKPAAKKAPAKKPEAASKPVAAKPATVAKATTARPQPKVRPAMMGGLIDTNLAASAAANLLLARRKGRAQLDDPISIDQIKSDLTKDHSAVAGEVLDQHAESTGARRPDLPFNPTGGGSTPHSQTVGHAAERTFVPRRTGG